jgi:hypothetical protein
VGWSVTVARILTFPDGLWLTLITGATVGN